MGISISIINNLITGFQRTSHGLTFVNAQQIEKINENGETVVDEDMVQKIVKERFQKTIFLA